MPQNMNYPGVARQETDNSLVSTPSNGTYVATMGRADKGIANSKVLVNSKTQLLNTFGSPYIYGSYPLVSAVDYGMYSALDSLNETSNVWYVRLTDGTEKYAVLDVSGTSAVSATVAYTSVSAAASTAYPGDDAYLAGNTLSDIRDYRSAAAAAIAGNLRIGAIGPGAYGNNIAVSIHTSYLVGSSATSGLVDWKNSYDTVSSATGAKWTKIFKINVFVKSPSDSWTQVSATVSGSPVETFYCSTDYTLIDNTGNSLFVEDVINGISQYIYVRSNVTDGTVPAYILGPSDLRGGIDSTTPTATLTADSIWSFFENKERTPLDVAIIVPRAKDAYSSVGEIQAVDALISKRLDFVAVVQGSALTSTRVATIKTDNNLVQNAIASNPSYFAKYAGWNLVFDRSNASRVFVPNCSYGAAIMARTDRISNPWEAPAGIDRAVIASGKQNIDLNAADGGTLYDLNINTIKFVNGVGNVIWGQKTAQLKKTARDRLNVRRALIYIENNVEKILNNFLFRGNTPKERERASSMINSFMQGVLAGGGVQTYKVVCDNSNNTSTTIANNILNVDLYIQPTYTIEFIKLNTVISADSVSTSEI